MEDSKDTVIVTGIGEKVTGEEFISLFQQMGDIKTESKTGQRLAIMRYTESGTREAIVTYKDPSAAEKAVKQLNGAFLGNSDLHVLTAEQAFRNNANIGKPVDVREVHVTVQANQKNDIFEAQYHLTCMYGYANTAWSIWMTGERTVINHPYPKGGKGGKGGGFWLFRGQDGQPGEDVSGGKGGEGGRGGCSVS